jgi:hypothetical protein
MENECTTVPFCTVGGEGCYELISDSKEISSSPLGTLLKYFSVREDMVIPLVKAVSLTPLSKPQRFYYKFGKPISTKKYNRIANQETTHELKEEVREKIQ